MTSSTSSADHREKNGAPRADDRRESIRAVDRELLIAVLRVGEVSVNDLKQMLGVTATAIRVRIERAIAAGWMTREKTVAGRGRPSFRYRLTAEGQQNASARMSDLADALWKEITQLDPPELRQQILSNVAKRLGRQLSQRAGNVADNPDHSNADHAFGELARVMSQSDMQVRVESKDQSSVIEDETSPVDSESSNAVPFANGNRLPVLTTGEGLPVLDIEVCPYPTLSDADPERTMCRLEEEMLSEALGKPVHLAQCRLDGDDCCQFTPVAEPTNPANESNPSSLIQSNSVQSNPVIAPSISSTNKT